MLREQSDERVRTIIERAAADTDAPAGSPTRKVGDLYRSFMDEARVEELGLSPIADDLAADRAVSSLDDLFRTLGRLQRQGGPGLFDFGVAPDAKNPEEYVLYLGQGGLGLPDESYYREERHAAILAAYLPHVARMLGLRRHRRRVHRRRTRPRRAWSPSRPGWPATTGTTSPPATR